MILSGLGKYKDAALLLTRVGLGVMFILHGYPKMIGGIPMWEKLGSNMSHLGINFYPVAWGFLAAFAEFIGGMLLILGLAFRPVCLLLIFTMIVAVLHHIKGGHKLMEASHAIEAGIMFLGLLFLGPGKYSMDKK